jgi:hypothetical protein
MIRVIPLPDVKTAIIPILVMTVMPAARLIPALLVLVSVAHPQTVTIVISVR